MIIEHTYHTGLQKLRIIDIENRRSRLDDKQLIVAHLQFVDWPEESFYHYMAPEKSWESFQRFVKAFNLTIKYTPNQLQGELLNYIGKEAKEHIILDTFENRQYYKLNLWVGSEPDVHE